MQLRPQRASFVLLVAALAVAGTGILLATRLARPSKAPVTGMVVDQPVPSVSLVDQEDRPSTLPGLGGRVMVLAPFLTLCDKSCPLTASAFLTMERDVAAAGLGSRVTFVEATVDPDRDTPARLRAFAQRTGANWLLLTGSRSAVSDLWKFFGVFYERTPEPSTATDWYTGQAEGYDVAYTDGLFFIGPHGHVRALIQGGPNVAATLAPALTGLLDAEGRSELAHPQGGWTVRQALDDLGLLLGRRIAG